MRQPCLRDTQGEAEQKRPLHRCLETGRGRGACRGQPVGYARRCARCARRHAAPVPSLTYSACIHLGPRLAQALLQLSDELLRRPLLRPRHIHLAEPLTADVAFIVAFCACTLAVSLARKAHELPARTRRPKPFPVGGYGRALPLAARLRYRRPAHRDHDGPSMISGRNTAG